jgi:hypothetical protein
MIRTIFSALVGAVVAGLVVAAVEAAGHRLFPPPEGLDPSDPEALAEAIATMPTLALLFVPLAWFLGTLVGAAVAANLSREHRKIAGLSVGGLIFAGSAFTLVQIPHPLWLAAAGLLGIPIAAWTGSRFTPT